MSTMSTPVLGAHRYIQDGQVASLGKGPRNESSPSQDAIKAIFSKAVVAPASQPEYSGIAIGAQYVNSDLTWLFRSGIDLANSLGNTALSHFLSHFTMFSEAMGYTSSGNSVIGLIEAKKHYDKMQAAAAVGDSFGEKAAQVSFLWALTQAAGGFAYALFRPLAIASTLAGVSAAGFTAPTLLGRATYGAGAIGNGIFAVFYGLLSVISGMHLYKSAQFKAKLNACPTDKDKMALLEKRLFIGPADVNKIRNKFTAEELKEEALASGSKMWRALVREMEKSPQWTGPHLSTKECRAMLENLFKDKDNELINAGIFFKLQKLQAKKEMKMSRAMGGEAVKLLQEAYKNGPLSNRLESANPTIRTAAETTAKAILDKIKEAAGSNERLQTALFILGIVGLVVSVLGFIFTGGVGAIVVAAISLALCIYMMSIDIYCLHQDIKAGNVGRRDTMMLFVSSILATLSFMATVVLTALVSGGFVPLIVAAIVLVGLLATNGATYAKIEEARKKQREENPTLAFCLKAHEDDSEYSDLEKNQIYQRLPAKEQILIAEGQKTFGISRRLAIQNRISQLEFLQQQQQEKQIDAMQKLVAAHLPR